MESVRLDFSGNDGQVHCLEAGREETLLDGVPCPLTGQERAVLLALVHRPGQTVPRSDLLCALWGPAAFKSRTIDVYIQRLRKKMPLLTIETIYRVGYRLALSPLPRQDRDDS